MNDRQSAAIILGMFTVAFILWYRKRSEEQRTALFGGSVAASTGSTPLAPVTLTIPKGFPILPPAHGSIMMPKDSGINSYGYGGKEAYDSWQSFTKNNPNWAPKFGKYQR